MRTTAQLSAVAASALLIAGLTACAPAAPVIEVELETGVTEVDDTTDATEGSNSWSVEEMTADLIQDFPDADTAALTALSERLDAAMPSALGVGVRVSIFEEGKVNAQIIVADADTRIPASELKALFAELMSFAGSPVTEWLIDAKEMVDGAYVDLTAVATEAGVPADAIGNWGDLTFGPELLATFA